MVADIPAPDFPRGLSVVAPGYGAPGDRLMPMNQIEAVLEMLPDATVVVAEDGRVVAANAQAGRLFSYPRQEIVGHSIEMLVPSGSRTSHARLRNRYWSWPDARPSGVSREVTALRANGETFPVEISLGVLSSADGRFVVACVRDLSNARRAWAELDGAHSQMSGQLLELEKHNRGLLGVDSVTHMLQSVVAEPEIYQIIDENGGRLFPELSGRLMLRDASETHLAQVASWGERSDDGKLLDANDCWAVRLGRVCGKRYPGSAPRCPHAEGLGDYLCTPLVALDRSLGALHLTPRLEGSAIGQVDEVLASSLVDHVALSLSNFRLLKLLESQAVRDPLSGLFNRRYMEEAVYRELRYSARHGRPFSFVLFDIDRFKEFNDSHGHDAADAIVRELARFLERNIRAEDIACRYGGDELVLILPDTPRQGAVAKAELLQAGIPELHVTHLGQPLPSVTVKAGISAYPHDGNDFVSLFRAADAALLRAKAPQTTGPPVLG
ncbi:MAG TPA: diguanylate cyclase [Acidimicrobiales bacterium]|nr:diguanylate cyclase [Acidimicrobiales bacterium]